jgi:hypothetical protein
VNLDCHKLLRAVQQVVDRECGAKAAALLSNSQSHMVDGCPTRGVVSQLLPTLRARLANAVRTGTRIYGLIDTIDVLSTMDSDAVVLGYGFISPIAAGNFYVTDGSESVVLGATLVDR